MVDPPGEPRPYHHGDLKAALVEAADRLLEREGLNALSLRAVAREAGVSAAAPYHHFKDKNELLLAVAKQGFETMGDYMRKCAEGIEDTKARLNRIGVAYVCFARDHPALYHLMYDSSRQSNFRAEPRRPDSGAMNLVRRALTSARGGIDPLSVELREIAGWCVCHGLAEMQASHEFDSLKARLGGDEAFYSAVLSNLDIPGDP